MAKDGFAKEYFSFTKKDRIAAFIIAGLMLIIYFLPNLLPSRKADLIVADSLFLQPADSSVLAASATDLDKEDHNSFEGPDREIFNFDPNTLSPAGWARLGLRPKTVRTIQNYLAKGGRFRKPEDLAKIWGLPPGFYDSVRDHILIARAMDPTQKQFTNNYEPYRSREPEVINANHADSISFTGLRGIGEKLAGRIIAFREKLGGFYSVEQIGETYGLPDSTFQKIKPQLKIDGDVRKININSATKDQLKVHPYFKWKLANAIVEYRNQHGNFQSIEDMKKIVLVDEKTFEKIRHYMTL